MAHAAARTKPTLRHCFHALQFVAMPRFSVLLVTMVAASACAARARTHVTGGSYRFMERVAEANPPVTIEGTVTIAGGFAELDLPGRLCRYDERSTSSSAVYDCGDVTVSVDTRMYLASYSVATMRRYPVRECALYQTTTTGDRVCVRYETRYEERPGRISGRLNLIRETAPPR
jgi:hypothetical protein